MKLVSEIFEIYEIMRNILSFEVIKKAKKEM